MRFICKHCVNQECYCTKQQTIDLYRAPRIPKLVTASCSRRLRPPPPSSTASAPTQVQRRVRMVFRPKKRCNRPLFDPPKRRPLFSAPARAPRKTSSAASSGALCWLLTDLEEYMFAFLTPSGLYALRLRHARRSRTVGRRGLAGSLASAPSNPWAEEQLARSPSTARRSRPSFSHACTRRCIRSAGVGLE